MVAFREWDRTRRATRCARRYVAKRPWFRRIGPNQDVALTNQIQYRISQPRAGNSIPETRRPTSQTPLLHRVGDYLRFGKSNTVSSSGDKGTGVGNDVTPSKRNLYRRERVFKCSLSSAPCFFLSRLYGVLIWRFGSAHGSLCWPCSTGRSFQRILAILSALYTANTRRNFRN